MFGKRVIWKGEEEDYRREDERRLRIATTSEQERERILSKQVSDLTESERECVSRADVLWMVRREGPVKGVERTRLKRLFEEMVSKEKFEDTMMRRELERKKVLDLSESERVFLGPMGVSVMMRREEKALERKREEEASKKKWEESEMRKELERKKLLDLSDSERAFLGPMGVCRMMVREVERQKKEEEERRREEEIMKESGCLHPSDAIEQVENFKFVCWKCGEEIRGQRWRELIRKSQPREPSDEEEIALKKEIAKMKRALKNDVKKVENKKVREAKKEATRLERLEAKRVKEAQTLARREEKKEARTRKREESRVNF